MNEAKVLLEIITNFIEQKEGGIVSEVDEEKLYQLAVNHRVSNFLVNWAKKKATSKKIKELVLADYHRQIIKDTNENIELEQILQCFEESGVKTLVAKGVTMKEVYPQSYMRQMCDTDLLVAPKDFKKAVAILKEIGYNTFHDTEHHLILKKEPFMIIELHRKLIFGQEIGYEYFNDIIWENAVPYQNYQHIFQMKREDAYIFCITHLIRHFKSSGIQIRDVLDVYLYHKRYKSILEKEAIRKKFCEWGIETFERNIREIAYQWFEAEVIEFDEVQKFILQGLSIQNQVNFEVGNKGSKRRYFRQLLFPEFNVMKEKYPILERAPFFLPATWLIRILRDIFSKGVTVKSRLDTVKLIQDTKQEEVDKIQKIYQKMGIIGKE